MTETAGPPRLSGGRHASGDFRAIAENGTILRCQAGSGLHGIAIGGQDDRDEHGICIEPPSWVIGVRGLGEPTPLNPDGPFGQYIYRTQPEGARSGAGDLDLTVFSLRKWMRLALAGNPTMLLPLFAPDAEIVTVTALGEELRALAPVIVSRQAGDRFVGYLNRQRESMQSHDGKGRDITRPELVKMHGYDTKYASHMVRLGYQGTELLETGRITLPMPEAQREIVRAVKTGGYSMADALAMAERLEARIRDLLETSPLPERPGYEAADKWMVSAYLRAWAGEAS